MELSFDPAIPLPLPDFTSLYNQKIKVFWLLGNDGGVIPPNTTQIKPATTEQVDE